MENIINDSKFRLSIGAALGIILLYNFILLTVCKIPFELISDKIYFEQHQISQIMVKILGEVIPNTIIITLLLKKIRKKGKINFTMRYGEKFNLKLVIGIILLMIGYFLWYQSSIGVLTDKIPVPKLVEEAFEELFINPYFAAISVAIIAPVFEEIMMRGIILEGFLNKYKPQTAIIASSILFGLIHLNIPQAINATIIGIILGIIYYKTRSIILCVIAHMVNNAIGAMLMVMNWQFNSISFFIGVVLFIIAVLFFAKYIKNYDENIKFL